MRSKKVNKNLIMMIIVLFITLGYAYLNSELKINGTTGIKANTWDVHFENVVPSSSNTATVNVAPVANPVDKVTNLTYEITFNRPGDVYEFNVDIVNGGTLDAMVELITSKIKIGDGEEQDITPATLPRYLNYYVKYSDGVVIRNNHLLNASTRETITVHVEYKMDISELDLTNSANKTIEFTYGLQYTQANDSAIAKPVRLNCTYDEELVNNASYTNGQYTYYYNSSTDGWRVVLTDKNSTDPVTTPLCSTINGKYINDMSGMFASSNTTSIDTSTFDTSYVTNMSGMFYNLKIDKVDVSSFDTRNVTNMSAMFNNCSELTELDLSSFDTSKVVNFSGLLSGTSNLVKIDFSNWDFSNNSNPIGSMLYNNGSMVKDLNFSNAKFGSSMYNYFYGLSNLESIKFKNVDTSNVTNMVGLFYNNTKLTELDLSDFDTSNVTNMSTMFYNVGVDELDVSSFDTSKVTNMIAMFYGCEELTELDLSNFNISNVTNFTDMFKNTYKLEKINFSNWDFSKVNEPLKNLLYNSGSYVKSLNLSNAKFGTDMSGYFINFTNLESINLDNVDTSSVTNMNTLFYNDTKLLELDLSDFDTSKVTSMEYMFYGTKFKELDLSSFDTSKVTVMSNIFNNMTDLEKLNLSGWDFSKLDQSFHTIVYHSSLKELDVSNATFGQDMSYGFYIPSLENLNLSGVDTSRVTDFSNGFQGLKIPSLDVTSLDMQNVTNAYNMFRFSQIERIDLSNSHFNSVESMESFCADCTNLKYVNLNNGGSDNLIRTADMFYGSHNIEEIYMKNFNFGTVSNLGTTQGPFYKKNKLRILDLSGAKMLKVNNFNMAFDSCYALNQLNLSNINAPLPIEHSNQMFSYNYQLTNLDLSSFDFSQLVSAGNMFTNVPATTVYVKTQADVDRLNEIVSDKPDTMTFVVKP